MQTDSISKRRLYLANYLDSEFKGVVRYGPFKGLRLLRDGLWSPYDKASQLLGIYEQELLSDIVQASASKRFLVNLGAADGYYAIGAVSSGLFERSWCFETNLKMREAIRLNANANFVEERVVTYGQADMNFWLEIPQEILKQAVILCDIEGAEFDVFTKDVFRALQESIVFIELHDFFYPNSAELLRRLRDSASKFFSISCITTRSRDLSEFPELSKLSDNDRWLICSEGRPRLMTWWRLDPK